MELNGDQAAPDDLRALGLTNYGHFTSVLVEDGHARGLAHHVERLRRDCRAVFGAELDPERVRGYVRRAVVRVDGTFIVRVTLFDRKLDIARPGGGGHPDVLVTARAAGPAAPPPLRVGTVAYARDLPAVKHLGIFGALHARRTARLDGHDDALFTGPDDLVSEGGTWNVGFVDAEGTVVWPEAPVLPGVTMTLLREHHEHLVAPVRLGELGSMRAAFATNTAIGVRPIGAVDGIRYDTEDPVLARLREAYLAAPLELV
ncbi:aminotransferase class IV [Streptomyces sp. NPDC001941]|uniref:aminotransferase class IV n=1 Tax=Streptomyces sp. NPDC001941 TaxID=3154659 RepID=UPI00331C2455